MEIQTVLEDNIAEPQWVLVHHDGDIPWVSDPYGSAQGLIDAARKNPGSVPCRLIPKPRPKGAVRYVHREF